MIVIIKIKSSYKHLENQKFYRDKKRMFFEREIMAFLYGLHCNKVLTMQKIFNLTFNVFVARLGQGRG